MKVHLVLDEASVEASSGVGFHLNQAVKHPENPVIVPGFPHQWDGLQINWPSVVLYDREEKLFKCWYCGQDAAQYDVNHYPERKGFAAWLGRMLRNGYAESIDGIHWVKPLLGQHEHRGAPTNSIATDYEKSGTGRGWDHFTSLVAVWINPKAKSADERYLALFTEIGSDEEGNRTFKEFRKVLYASPDGKRWARRTVAYDGGSPDGKPAPGIIDINSVIYDMDDPDPQKRVKAYGQSDRPIRPGRGNRGVAMVYGSDFSSLRYDGQIVLIEGQEPYEDEIHWNTVRKLENGYYLIVHDSSRFDYDNGVEPPISDIRIAMSMDGIIFRRIHPDTPIISRGTKAMFDANQLVSSSAVEFGDEVFIYYHGTPCIYRPWPHTPAGVPHELRAATVYPTFMGLATLPRDRFAYVAPAGRSTGTLDIKLSDVREGGEVWLNADGDIDSFGLSLLTDDDKVAATGRLGVKRLKTVYRNTVWDSAISAGIYRLRVQLRDSARLYSIGVLTKNYAEDQR
ncbi:MAG: hypothetical protein M1133_09405 [Armatimonadetes bacterium]|nr:hypothetical protein [Armatimonadota bacterium]